MGPLPGEADENDDVIPRAVWSPKGQHSIYNL